MLAHACALPLFVWHERSYKFEIFVCYTSWFSTKVILLEYWIIVASPGSLKGQRRGTCGHAMAAFDLHEKCAWCCDKKVGDGPCVKGQDCVICEGFMHALFLFLFGTKGVTNLKYLCVILVGFQRK